MRLKQKNNNKRDDTSVNVENPQCGKNHGSPQTAEYTKGEEYNSEDTQRQRPLVLFFATRGSYNEGNDLTHTHTHSLSLTLSLCTRTIQLLYKSVTTTTKSVCPKSYLYIYNFRVIYISVLPNRSDGSEPGHRNRVFGLPVLPNFHPEGPVSQHL